MAFEEMQVIWNKQDQERVFMINEAALHSYIQGKGNSVNRLLSFFEIAMIALNFGVGLVLVVDLFETDFRSYQLILPLMYLAYAIGITLFRRWRHREEIRFTQTILGELDKAIWRIDQLIKHVQSMLVWYLLPLILGMTVMLFFNTKLVWAWVFMLLAIPVGYYGGRWEINKWYLPKKRELEAIREKLVAAPPL